MDRTPAPVVIGLLFDFPQADGGSSFEEAVRLGMAEVGGRLDRPVAFVRAETRGLPLGTARDVEIGFDGLLEEGVLAIVGPSISDNGLFVRDLADAAQVPCINYTGGERTRSEWMFHYQVGSLEEEPAVLAEHLAGRDYRTAAVIHDHSPVGSRYAEFFDLACGPIGIEVTGRAAISPLAEDARPLVERLAAGRPDALVYLGLGVSARTVALGVAAVGWEVPVVANSALMFGYAQRDWRAGWEGWVYVDTVADTNPRRAALRERSPATAAGPVGVAGYDIGRLLGEAVARAGHLTRAGIRDALERVKRLPASSGQPGTTMGFGAWDHGALKGDYLVLRVWRDGRTVHYSTGG
jgi:ABC-type branched-subunit amino acid transport system substrate-binding protein